jgi:hypothetical protein
LTLENFVTDWRCVMVRRCVLFVVVALVLPFSPVTTLSGQEWPGKDDLVYVAATFKDVESLVEKTDYKLIAPLEACARLTIREAKPGKSRWTVQALEVGPIVRLEGPWLSRMHKTKEDCSSQLSAEGEPNLKRFIMHNPYHTGYKIIPAK